MLALQLAGMLCLAFRLFHARLHRIYPAFAYLQVFGVVQWVFISTTYGTPYYVSVYVTTSALSTVIQVLIILELYSRILRGFSGIASIARTYTYIALTISILISLVLVRLEKTPVSFTAHFILYRRSLISTLVFFILLMLVLLIYYPIPLSRNVAVYFAGYTVYFLCTSTVLFARNIGIADLPVINNALLTIPVLCLFFWAIVLNPRGETTQITIGHRWNRDDEARLLQQLRAMNSTLSQTARK